jgi:hypothetical protein
MSWFYNSGFSGTVWRWWLGLRVHNVGGPQLELGEEGRTGGEGRMCVPPMLLHPIKGVELPVEEVKVDMGGEGMDAGA